VSTVSRRRALADVGAQLGLRGLNLALGVVVTVLLVRALGPDQFGQWSTVLAVVSILTYFGDIGLQQAAVSRTAGDPEEARLWIGALLTLRLALCVPAALIGACVIAVVAKDTRMLITGFILCGAILLSALSASQALFQIQVRNDLTASFELANGLAWGAAVIALYLVDAGMVVFAAAFIGAGVLSTCGQLAYAVRRFGLRPTWSRARWRQLVSVGLPVGVAGMLILAYGRIDQILVFELAGDRAAGLYGAAYRIFERAAILPATVMTTVYPLLAAARGTDMERMRRVFVQSGELLLLASLPFLVYTAVESERLVGVLFGAGFLPAATALVVLMGAFVLVCFGYLAGFTVTTLELQRRFVRYAVVGLIFNAGANLLLIPRFGFVAAAWITLLTEVVVLTPTFVDILRAMGLRPPLARSARIAAAGALLGAALLGLRAVGAPLAATAVAAALLYPGLLLALRGVEPSELRALRRPDPAA
jgi:O-antigen/teichoic acid export membrane protein